MNKNENKIAAFNERLNGLTSINFGIGGGLGDYVTTEIVLGEKLRIARKHRYAFRNREGYAEIPCSREELLEAIRGWQIGAWKKSYKNGMICDGTFWSLTITFADSPKPVEYYGENAYPENFWKMTRFFESFCGEDNDVCGEGEYDNAYDF